ncbi:hypothetical protein BU16DRAFT_271123 [Lophium mytilinum]|uniref:ferric-chelate reductase (NADPH) n=1 Tax=Lophium mytilinum TaxID=390894 RepID=A0A6A6R4I9_9PEZI|nr:hypothetical protein BU16DRAFT_271123 [Lophium mytilinum]
MDMDMTMGSMSMGGLPKLLDFPSFYWAVVGTAIGIATFVNFFNYIIYRQRLSAASNGNARPAKPTSFLARTYATITAITREASNASVRIPSKGRVFKLPTVGRTSLVVGNVVLLVVLSFYGLDVKDRWKYEDIGYRTGFVNMAQLPLIFLLAGKNNIIGFLSGISHERLNWLHRWAARCLLFTTTIHMGYFFADWAPYDYIIPQIKSAPLVKEGVIAWAVLLWMVVSSMTPIRGLYYEVFVIQHLASFAVFLYFVYKHTPAEVHVYIWIPIGVFVFDRVTRGSSVIYTNLSLFHPKQRKAGQMSGLWACKAEFTPLAHDTTRITINNPPISWSPGQHVFLSCHSIVPLQSHPFTVASIPEDGKMEFLVKAEKGGTKRFFKHAEKLSGLPSASPNAKPKVKSVAIEGPYGCLRPLRQFDSVVLLAGSTGATFTIPLLRDIVQGWKEVSTSSNQKQSIFRKPKGAVTRHIRFVWVVKSRGQLGWFADQLSGVFEDIENLKAQVKGLDVDMTIYVTCDNSFTEEHKSLLSTVRAPVKTNYRGAVEMVEGDGDEKSGLKYDEQNGAREVGSETSSLRKPTQQTSCGPNGECCCRDTVESEDIIGPATCCCCSSPPATTDRTQSAVSSITKGSAQQLLHPSIAVISGRPQCHSVIRKMLEQALGESAVVVCGPQGLVADVKQSVVALSDERAVHKGTGAQGIYLHTESFGY